MCGRWSQLIDHPAAPQVVAVADPNPAARDWFRQVATVETFADDWRPARRGRPDRRAVPRRAAQPARGPLHRRRPGRSRLPRREAVRHRPRAPRSASSRHSEAPPASCASRASSRSTRVRCAPTTTRGPVRWVTSSTSAPSSRTPPTSIAPRASTGSDVSRRAARSASWATSACTSLTCRCAWASGRRRCTRCWTTSSRSAPVPDGTPVAVRHLGQRPARLPRPDSATPTRRDASACSGRPGGSHPAR